MDRFKLFKNVLTKNRIKFVLLEKFVFINIIDYAKSAKIVKLNNVIVNVWGGILYRILNLQNLKKTNKVINIKVPQGSLLTNLIHYFYLFSLIDKNKINIQSNIIKILNSKRKPYHELVGDITLKTKKIL